MMPLLTGFSGLIGFVFISCPFFLFVSHTKAQRAQRVPGFQKGSLVFLSFSKPFQSASSTIEKLPVPCVCTRYAPVTLSQKQFDGAGVGDHVVEPFSTGTQSAINTPF